jgi:outer-membrane receptor for ferric coprogen and ferric-rhodotorulic acid
MGHGEKLVHIDKKGIDMGIGGRLGAGLLARASVAAVAIAVCAPTNAWAQDAGEAQVSFNVSAGPLGAALAQFGQQAKVSLVYPAELAQGRSTSGVRGAQSVRAGLARLLAGTGLSFRYSSADTIVIEVAAPSVDGERVLGAVRIEGAQGFVLAGATSVNGINGSRDVTATEGTGSYTTGAMTIGSKTAASIKDVPASVSVLASAQIQDQNITGIRSAMERLPGVISHNGGDTAHPEFYSRGFQITTFQIDGGAGLRTTGGNGNVIGARGGTYVPQMDMSLYDHVEIVRGAAGTFNGFGDPGGVINLVRKRPLDHSQLLVEGQLGSYELRRASVDLTGPIAFDGKLRGRLIATHQDNNFFYEGIHQDKNLISATLEFDASPTTLVSVGGSYDRQHGGMWTRGLMRFGDGRPLPVPRSICICQPWVKFDTRTVEGFAQIEQKMGSRWNLKYKVTYQKQIQDTATAYTEEAVDPTIADPQINLWSDIFLHGEPRRFLQEVTVDGSFRLFGQDQKIVAGGNMALIDGKGARNYFPNTFSNGEYNVGINPLAYNPNDPRWADPGRGFLSYVSLYNSERMTTAYIRLDLSPLPRLHLLTSINYTSSSIKTKDYRTCVPNFIRFNLFGCTTLGTPLPDQTASANFITAASKNISWPPSTSLRYDFSEALSGYATYADIHVDQSTYLRRDESSLNPIVGANYEGGVKWAPNDGKLNFSLSGYYTRQSNFSVADCHDSALDEDDNWVPDGTPACRGVNAGKGETTASLFTCCFKDNPNYQRISFGLDLEFSGQIRPNWQVSASYNFNKNVVRGLEWFYYDQVTGDRVAMASFSPRHLYKLWTNYRFSEGSNLRGLEMNFGAQGQSMTFVSTSYCPEYAPAGGCAVLPRAVHFSDPGHVIFALGGSYKITPNVTLQVNIENLLDKTYFAQVGGLIENWYGAPRNFAVTLRGKW